MAYFELVLIANHKIFGFDVAVHDPILMQELNAAHRLNKKVESLLLPQDLVIRSLNVLEQAAVGHVLLHKVKVFLLVFEGVVQPDDVLVHESFLNVDFAP
jgi:hypothetical protein